MLSSKINSKNTFNPFFNVLIFLTGNFPENPACHEKCNLIWVGRSFVLILSGSISFAFALKNFKTINQFLPSTLESNTSFNVFLGRLPYHSFIFSLSANLLVNGKTTRIPGQSFIEDPKQNKSMVALMMIGLIAAGLPTLVFVRPLLQEDELPVSFIYIIMVARFLQLSNGIPSSLNNHKDIYRYIKNTSNRCEKTSLWGLYTLAILATLFIGYSNTKFTDLPSTNTTTNFIDETYQFIGSLPLPVLLLIRLLFGGVVYAATFASIFFKGGVLGFSEGKDWFLKGMGAAPFAILGAALSAFANVADFLAACGNSTQTNISNIIDPLAIPLPAKVTAIIEFSATGLINLPSMFECVYLSLLLVQIIMNHCCEKKSNNNEQALLETSRDGDEGEEIIPELLSSNKAWPDHLNPSVIVGGVLLLGLNPALMAIMIPSIASHLLALSCGSKKSCSTQKAKPSVDWIRKQCTLRIKEKPGQTDQTDQTKPPHGKTNQCCV